MYIAIIILSTLIALPLLYLAAWIWYEIRVYGFYREMKMDYDPCWLRIWHRLAAGTTGVDEQDFESPEDK